MNYDQPHEAKSVTQNPAYGRQSISRPMRIVAPIPQQGGPRIPKNPNCLKKRKKIIQYAKTQKRLEICQNQRYALRPQVSNSSGSVVSTLFWKAKFQTTSKQKCSNLRPLLSLTFPQGFRISKNIGHPTLESGGIKTFKRYLKSEHTDGETNRQTDKQKDGYFDLQKASAHRDNALKMLLRSTNITNY